MPDVFLSYNREDQAKAKLIAEALEADGISVWWDTVLRAGETYDEVTERHLRESKAVVVLWSQKSVRSKWVRAEATLGERKSALVPAMIEPCERPILFELIQTADLSHWQGDHKDPRWLNFLEDVRERVSRGAAPTTAPPAAPAAVAAAKAVEADPNSIETAFWMSVQDSEDAADFESYLRRFPSGHFADLAERRVQALRRPPPAPPPAAPKPPPPVAAAPPPPPRAETPAKPAARSSGGNGGLLFGGAAAVLALAAAAFFLWPRPDAEQQATAEAPAAAATPVATAPAATPETPAAAAAQPDAAGPFRDCPECPQMVRLPAASFQMGSPEGEQGRNPWEGPQRTVTVPPFAIGAHEVTFAQWDACVAGGGCNGFTPGDRGWGRGDRPVMGVSWDDAQSYVRWLSTRAGRPYRLPTEAEWEYAARGGTATAYWWGAQHDPARVPRGQTQHVGAFPANAFGVHDAAGNVREWVEDCYVNTFAAAPTDGSAVLSGNCAMRVLRGGGWRSAANEFRVANRVRLSRTTRDATIGFRVVSAP